MCTTIAPDNTAISKAMKALGSSVGLFLQNKTLQAQTFNYHIIPGRRITAQDMAKNDVTTALTRANQTIWFIKRG